MPFSSFRELIAEVKKYPRTRLCVAAAADEKVLLAVKDAAGAGFVDPVLVGDVERIWNISVKISLDLRGIKIVSCGSPVEAARTAVCLTASGEADVLMKGMVNSSDFLREVMRRENGLTAGRLLSHLAVFEIPGFSRLLFKTDGGLNISPDLAQKKEIIINAVDFITTIGIGRPRVAVLSTGMKGGAPLPSAPDAVGLKDMAREGLIRDADVDGPMGLGPAVDLEEADLLGFGGPVAGRADLILVPGIEAGNAIGKSIIHFAGGRMAGLVVGAKKPVIMTSRAETSFGRLSSLAFACYYMAKRGIK